MNSSENKMHLISHEDIEQLFAGFSGKRVMIIGDVMVDAYLWGNVERISPEAPVPVVVVNRRSSRLGGAANVALNVKALGAEAVLFSVVGNDQKGDELIDLMKAEGLDNKGIIKSDSRKTTTKFRIFGNRTQMLRVDEETTDPLSPEDMAVFSETIINKINSELWDVIIFQDYDKGIINAELIDTVCNAAGDLHIPIAVDPKKRHFTDYRHVNLFKPNLKEFRDGILGVIDPGCEEDFEQAVINLHKSQDIVTILITLSNEGVYVSHLGEGARLPAYVREVSDVSGAGDTVISVAALGLACGLTPVQYAALGNLAGGLVCEEVGVVPVNREKLKQEAIKNLT